MINKHKYHAVRTTDGFLAMDNDSSRVFIFEDEEQAEICCDEYINAEKIVPCYIFTQSQMDKLLQCLKYIDESCDIAMDSWAKTPIPHCDNYAVIAQDLDYVRRTIKDIL